MMRTLAFGLFFLFLSSTTFAQEPEPFDFKGMALGSDAFSVEGTSRFHCGDPKSPIADRSCSLRYDSKETIAGVPIRVLLLYYYSGKLESITIAVNQQNFSQVAAALAEKYGEGAVRTETAEPVNNNETVGSRGYCSGGVSRHRLSDNVNVNVDPAPI